MKQKRLIKSRALIFMLMCTLYLQPDHGLSKNAFIAASYHTMQDE